MDKPYDGQKQKYTHEGNHGISYKTAQVISIWLGFVAQCLSPSSKNKPWYQYTMVYSSIEKENLEDVLSSPPNLDKSALS